MHVGSQLFLWKASHFWWQLDCKTRKNKGIYLIFTSAGNILLLWRIVQSVSTMFQVNSDTRKKTNPRALKPRLLTSSGAIKTSVLPVCASHMETDLDCGMCEYREHWRFAPLRRIRWRQLCVDWCYGEEVFFSSFFFFFTESWPPITDGPYVGFQTIKL